MATAALLVAGIFTNRLAEAQNKYLCCSLGGQGDCVAQTGPCADGTGVTLLDAPEDAGAGWSTSSGVPAASFPAGVDGHVWWSSSQPRLGFCLDAPSAQDPAHAGPTEPIGCLSVSLAPGVGAAASQYVFPVDNSLWDAYQLCYGPQVTPSNAVQYMGNGAPATCANINDLLDPTVSPTPVSGSCCGGPQLLMAPGDLLPTNGNEWSISVDEEIPGVPPNELVRTLDGGFRAYPDWDAGDQLETVPDTCLGAYNESAGCGSPPSPSLGQSESLPVMAYDGPSVDGGGGASGGGGSSSGGGGCTVDAPGAPVRTGVDALLVLGAIASVRRRVRVLGPIEGVRR